MICQVSWEAKFVRRRRRRRRRRGGRVKQRRGRRLRNMAKAQPSIVK